MTEDEQNLIARLRAGEEPAWDSFLCAIQTRLFDAIELRVPDRNDAEDLFSNVILIIVRGLYSAAKGETL